ncbi:MAG: adenylate/guanylate cyclase domain-containing protein [Thermoflexales bacterium]|nr:adenylate/guanylate cyclase domain-containing protein [Thermoflexales bacterium]
MDTPSLVNEPNLEQKLQALGHFKRLEPALVQRFGEWLRPLDDWQLFRINPLRFAREHELDTATSLDLFLHGAKVGLFDLAYNMVCPYCGAVEYSHAALDQIEADHFFCTVCKVPIPSTLDQQVQVSFALNPAVHALNVDPYADVWAYLRYYFSEDYERQPAIRTRMAQNVRGFAAGAPDSDLRITFQAEAGQSYRATCLDYHTSLYLHVADETTTLQQIVDVDLLPGGLAPNALTLSAGEVTLLIHNRTKSLAGVDLFLLDPVVSEAMMAGEGASWRPYLTGKMLLNNQTFRDLFRIQTLAPDLKLNIRSLTIMFTDLKNSTEIYKQVGDVAAYSLVQEHFDHLTDVVRRHAGSIVKTMGDAIMATFSDPQAGLLAALEMVQAMEHMRQRLQSEGRDWGIKIGLNEGSVLAVNADDRLDYFGQNVNIAARVQGLAQAGEIWLTEPVYEAPTIAETLVQHGYRARQQSALLKGIGEQTLVYQCQGV